jgi:hypothetical protein
MNEIALSLILVVLGFSLLLFTIALLSAVRVRSAKTSLLSIAFLFYVLKEMYVLYLFLTAGFEYSDLIIGLSLLDLIVLFFFYAAVLK